MADERVLRFERSDNTSQYVLVYATSSGSKPLDLNLVASEGAFVYVSPLKSSKIDTLRVKNSPASEKEWHAILEALFSQEPQPNIQATATVEEGSLLSITVRKQVQGITQRLGSIELKQKDRELDVFEWCGVAARDAIKTREANVALEARTREQEDTIAELKTQLEELLAAKKEDETVLLQHFCDLINEKKVKIREYHKIIQSTSSMPRSSSVPDDVQPQAAPLKRKPRKSRPAKRRVDSSQSDKEEEEHDDGGDKMEVDSVKSEPDHTDSGHGSEVTASATDDSDADEVMETSPTNAILTESAPAPAKKTNHQPPPKRELPFAGRRATRQAPAAPAGGSETESDDEL